MSQPEKAKLRIGLLVNSLYQARWVHKIVEDISRSSIAEVVLIIKNETETKTGWKNSAQKVIDKRDRILYKLYSELDEKLFPSACDPNEAINIEPLVENCPVIHVKPVQQKYSDYFPEEDISAILEYKLDVAFRFGFRILKGEALNIAKYGVWSYHHGDNLNYRGAPPGFWEVMQGDAVTGSILQILTPELDGGKVLYRSWASTYQFSVKRNRDDYFWKSSNFAVRKLRDLYETGAEALENDDLSSSYRPYDNPLYKTPTNGEMLPLVWRMANRLANRAVEKAFYLDQWFLAYKIGKKDAVAETFYNFKPLVPPKDRFWADPFPVEKDGKYYIFIEEFMYKTGKAHISVIEMDRNGEWKSPVKVLERDYHLSYPFVFAWKDDYYMLPETADNKTVELYRCVSFPFEWQLEKVLMENVVAVDATLAEIDDRWWMFVNMGMEEAESKSDELFLFYADSPLDDSWTPHKRNPVKSDVRRARPAGRLFRWKNDLYRPAQDCSTVYGHAVSINKICRLTPEEFLEEEVSKIMPEWNKDTSRIHTLNHCGNLTVIDGLMRRRRLF